LGGTCLNRASVPFTMEKRLCAYAAARIIGNRIYDTSHELIDVNGDPVIRDNVIGRNSDHACIHMVQGSPIIENNDIHEARP